MKALRTVASASTDPSRATILWGNRQKPLTYFWALRAANHAFHRGVVVRLDSDQRKFYLDPLNYRSSSALRRGILSLKDNIGKL